MIGGRLLVLEEVAEEIGCSVATVKRRVRSGEILWPPDANGARR